jgi:hypothetical protein
MERAERIRIAVAGAVALDALVVGVAFAADPVDHSFGSDGVATIEARIPATGQVGGIVDLEAARGGKLLAAIYPIAVGGHYFAAARLGRDGSLGPSFGQGGFTPKVGIGKAREENGEGTLQAEAVTGQRNGAVVLAGYLQREGAYAPAVARFTREGALDPTFGSGGKVVPSGPTAEGRHLSLGERTVPMRRPPAFAM